MCATPLGVEEGFTRCASGGVAIAQPPANVCDPFGGRRGILTLRVQWCRCAQPPANVCDPFGGRRGILTLRVRWCRFAQPPANFFDPSRGRRGRGRTRVAACPVVSLSLNHRLMCATPPGVEEGEEGCVLPRVRWCRCAQPPANVCDPSPGRRGICHRQIPSHSACPVWVKIVVRPHPNWMILRCANSTPRFDSLL